MTITLSSMWGQHKLGEIAMLNLVIFEPLSYFSNVPSPSPTIIQHWHAAWYTRPTAGPLLPLEHPLQESKHIAIMSWKMPVTKMHLLLCPTISAPPPPTLSPFPHFDTELQQCMGAKHFYDSFK